MTTQAEAARELPRVLGLGDVVLLYAVAIVGPQWLSTAAQAGASSSRYGRWRWSYSSFRAGSP